MDNLDLDINNYTIRDIERFFRLKHDSNYNASDIELCEYKIREQLLGSGHINKRFKRDLIEFLNSAKEWLTFVKCKPNQPTSIPKNYKLDKLDTPLSREPIPRTDEIITRPETKYTNVTTSDFFPGTMNQLSTRIITKCLNIDTRFRENYYSMSCSDFIIHIPEKMNKVVSMQLGSIELPICWYGITSDYGNSHIYISLEYNEINSPETIQTAAQVFTIPDGNYNSVDLIDVLNAAVSPKTATNILVEPNNIFSYLLFTLDITNTGSGTGKVILQTAGLYAKNILSITLDFNRDKNGNPTTTTITNHIGWNLGFIKPLYSGANFYASETVIEPVTTRYIYLVVDDFTNSAMNTYISAFKDSMLSSNILARLSVRGSYFSLLMDSDHSVVSEPRRYFGPVDIQRMRIRLIDEYGRTVNMNYSDFSFTIVLKQLYDL